MSELSNEVEELKGQLVALEEESVKEKQSLIAESNQHKKEVSVENFLKSCLISNTYFYNSYLT